MGRCIAVIRSAALVAGLIGTTVLSGCGDDDDDALAVEIDATTYVAAIEGFLPPRPSTDELVVVFVVPVGDESLDFDSQVAVIDALSEHYDVRFVDDLEAAIDDGTADGEPRDDGTLIGVGSVAPDPPHKVRIEIYEGRDAVEGYLLTMGRRSGGWAVVADEEVEPEVLVAGD